MVEISSEEFERKIKSNEEHFRDIIINFDNEIDLKTPLLSKKLTFKNVTFKGMNVIFSNNQVEEISKNSSFIFEDCNFLCDFLFSSCSLENLTFISCTINNKSIEIRNCYLNNLSFEENTKDIHNVKSNIIKSSTIKINHGKINHIEFDNIQFNGGALRIIGQKSAKSLDIINSILNKVIISHCHFSDYFDYLGNNVNLIADNNHFNRCTFNNSSFFETKFNSKTHFNNCIFNNTANFQSIKNEIDCDFKFTDCDFNKFVDFDKSKIDKLRFEKIKFHDFASFQETYFNIIEIDKTSFEKGAFFDDIQIKKINDCDRRTIRTIKQQLQKTENRIDFNRFRSHELAAHYKELNWKWNSGFIDKSILFASKISTDFGNSWRKALRFILIGGFIIYLLLYIFENRDSIINLSNIDNWTRLFSGFFRFLLVTDFYNPLETDRIYLTNPFSWLIFIFGKIFIAFGIYEMIQSFRKFKA
ncbi:hypothetical protein [uncultured Flavobacterium sp.]|uniref:hypothetical protein n=1 Tax=uncultured Flavobacterium sp. TaxID=165435 RepID=UPI00308176E9